MVKVFNVGLYPCILSFLVISGCSNSKDTELRCNDQEGSPSAGKCLL